MTPIYELPLFKSNVPLPFVFAQTYVLPDSEVPNAVPRDKVRWEEDVAFVRLVLRPLPRPHDPATEAREAITYMVMLLDLAMKECVSLDGFAFLGRQDGRALYLIPGTIRSHVEGERNVPLISVAYQQCCSPLPKWMARQVTTCVGKSMFPAFLQITNEAIDHIIATLNAFRGRGLYKFPKVSPCSRDLKLSCFLPCEPRPMTSLPVDVRAAIAEFVSMRNKSCVICHKEAKGFCKSCGSVMYCSPSCQQKHCVDGGHLKRC